MLFFLGFFCFVVGISCWIFSDSTHGVYIWTTIVLSIIFFWGWKRSSIVIFWLIFCFLGFYLSHEENESRKTALETIKKVTYWFSGSYTVQGKVERLLYTNNLSHTYRLNIDNIDNRSTKNITDISEKNIGILFEIPKNLHINIGDTVEYTGKIFDIIDPSLDGFSGYTWYHRIYGKSIVPTFKRITKTEENLLQSIQNWAKWSIFRWFPENISGIILWRTIGNRELLSRETKKQFPNAGITHILVVSGSNIAFVIVIISGILRYTRIRKWIQMSLIIGFVLFYGTLVGWDMPVIRAVAMWLIIYISLEWWKKSSSIAILFGVAFCILIYSPLSLIYDAGFGLSFAGTLWILLFHLPIQEMLQKKHIPRFLSDIISVTLSATLWSMIATIYHFWTIPLYTVISNILIGGILWWILFSSMFYFILSLFGWWILYLWWWTIYLPTLYILTVGEYFWKGYTYTIDEHWIQPISLFLIGISISLVFYREKRKLLQSK